MMLELNSIRETFNCTYNESHPGQLSSGTEQAADDHSKIVRPVTTASKDKATGKCSVNRLDRITWNTNKNFK